jgi:SAM-dependent methyltransferase
MDGIRLQNTDPPPFRACPVCASRRSREHRRAEGKCFLRCRDCQSMYVAEPPDQQELRTLYESADYSAARGHAGDSTIESAKAATVRAYLRRLDYHAAPGRRYLEVGCSTGAGLTAAAAAGWEPAGIEFSPPAAAIARTRGGVRAVHVGTVLDAPFDAGSFDVVTMFDVIEHIDPPQPTIERVRQLLRPGGLYLLLTPDAGSVSARMLGRRWPHLLSEHVVCFSRRGLRQVLEATGFQVLEEGFAWKRVNLEMLLRHAALHPEVAGSGLLRRISGVLPRSLRRFTMPFNVGEFYAIARRNTDS